MPRFLLLTGIIVLLIADHGAAAAGSNADAARPLEPAASWCVIRHDSRDQPACYENLISCLMAALAHASSCTQQRTSPGPLSQGAANQRALRVVRLPGHRADASPRQHKFNSGGARRAVPQVPAMAIDTRIETTARKRIDVSYCEAAGAINPSSDVGSAIRRGGLRRSGSHKPYTNGEKEQTKS